MTTTQKPDVAGILKAICDSIVEAVAVGGTLGVPGGTLYAALMTQGCTLAQFEAIMGALVAAGKLDKRGELYFAKDAK